MKLYSKLSALGAALVLSTAFASATTISIGSYASTGANTGGFGNSALQLTAKPAGTFTGTLPNTYQLDNVTPTWTAAIGSSVWVGVSPNAGPSGTINPRMGNYTFTTDLGSGLAGYSGSIDVLADDTTSVLLNGVQLVAQGGGTDGHCEQAPPNCVMVFNVGLPGGAAFNAGDNTLTFVVKQQGTGGPGVGGNPSGVDFNGSISSGLGSTIPEPSTLLLLGTGLLGSAGTLLRRMRS